MSFIQDASTAEGLPPDFQLGPWLVQPRLRRMGRDAQLVPLGARLCLLLSRLAHTPGEVVTREELLDAIWGDTVIAEEGLTVAVSELRRLLGDDPQQPRFIETIRGVGYRLVCPVTPQLPSTTPVPTGESSPRPFDLLPLLPRSRGLLVSSALLLIAATLVVIWARLQPPRRAVDVVPLTSMPGAEIHPAVSPASEQVVFAADHGDGLDLYVVQAGADAPVRLSFDVGDEDWPAISPDGITVAFTTVRRDAITGSSSFGISTVPLGGGTPRQLIATPETVHGLSFAPDGTQLTYAMGNRVWLLDLDRLSTTALPTDGATERARTPSFSPDGSRIAFISGTLQLNHVYVYQLQRGWLTRVALSQRHIAGLDWSTDGQGVIFAAAPAGRCQLWRVELAGGSLTRLPVESQDARYPSVGRRGDLLVFQETLADGDIWRAHLDASTAGVLPMQALISSTRLDGEAHSSPTGGQIAFVSARSGHRELWTADADGRGVRRVTDFAGAFLSHPRWSPDGRHLACNAVSAHGVAELWVVDVASGKARRVSRPDQRAVLEEWSNDGESLVAMTPAVGGWKVVRIAVADGREHWLLPVGCRLVGELDQHDLLFVDGERNVLRRRRAVDGALVDVTLLPPTWSEVLLRRDITVVVSRIEPAGWELSRVHLDTGEVETIGRIEGTHAERHLNPDLSADGHWLLFDHQQGNESSDLMLMRGSF